MDKGKLSTLIDANRLLDLKVKLKIPNMLHSLTQYYQITKRIIDDDIDSMNFVLGQNNLIMNMRQKNKEKLTQI